MNRQEFDKRKAEIVASGKNALHKKDLIDILTKEYYNGLVFNDVEALRKRIESNINYLAAVFKRKPTWNGIVGVMQVDTPDDLKSWMFDQGKISTIRSCSILSLFYGVTLDTLINLDLELIKKDDFVRNFRRYSRQN